MYGLEITELGQISQQENMQRRAQAQAERRGRRAARQENARFFQRFRGGRGAASRQVVACHYGASSSD